MGFKLYRERMGDELYSKKMKEADEVCELLIYKSAREMANGKFATLQDSGTDMFCKP